MTKLRRVAQVVEDLRTIKLITDENQVHSHSSLNGWLTVTIFVSQKREHPKYVLIKNLFIDEFSNEVLIIEDSEWLQIILE